MLGGACPCGAYLHAQGGEAGGVLVTPEEGGTGGNQGAQHERGSLLHWVLPARPPAWAHPPPSVVERTCGNAPWHEASARWQGAIGAYVCGSGMCVCMYVCKNHGVIVNRVRSWEVSLECHSLWADMPSCSVGQRACTVVSMEQTCCPSICGQFFRAQPDFDVEHLFACLPTSGCCME